jgi:hypothetical protein
MASVARQFTRPDSEVIIASAPTFTAGGFSVFSIAAILKTTDVTNTKVIASFSISPGPATTFQVDPDESVAWFDNVTKRNSAASRIVSGTWHLVCFTKATGTVTGRFHTYNYSTRTWVHENASGTSANSGALFNDDMYIGQDNGSAGAGWEGQIQALGVWKSELTDAQVEELAPNSLAWKIRKPDGLWLLSQPTTGSTVVDESGNLANSTGQTGTAITIGNPDFDQPPVNVNPVVPHDSTEIALPFPMGFLSTPQVQIPEAGAVAAVIPLQQADIVTGATLAVTAQTGITLATSTIQTAATLNLTAPALLTLSSAAIQTAATLNLTAPAKLTLSSAAIQTSATLFVTAQTYIPQGTSTIQTSATLALSAQTTIPLGSAALVFGQGGLKVTEAPTQVILQQSDPVFSATLALFTPKIVPLDPAAIQTSATLALTAKTTVVLGTSAVVTSATLFLTAQTYVVLSSAAVVTTASLTNFSSGTPIIPMQTAAIVTSATLSLTAKATVVLTTAALLTTASLTVTTPAATGDGIGMIPFLILLDDDD